jgi:citrate synthase
MSGPVTHIATADATSVTVRGRDLVDEIIGKLTFTQMFYLLMTGRTPSGDQTRVLDACLVTLMEHGFTPSALVARLMAESSPGQIQASIAAGLLAVGDVHAGTMEACAALLVEGVDEPDQEAWCRDIVAAHRTRRTAVPGFGHKLHKPDDPRTPPLLRVARETGHEGRYVQLLLRLSRIIDETAARHVTINATGALAALLLEIGIPPGIVRAIAVVSRSGGLVGHILEEQQTSSARHLVKLARDTIPYRDPPD